MRKMELEQASTEWLLWRKDGIGASDVPIIMGESPYGTTYTLWLEKLGVIEKRMNSNMQYGKDKESYVRKSINEMEEKDYEPACFESNKFPWMKASLDGYSEKHGAIEIKCCNKEEHESARKGEIPLKYKAQLQHQMSVLNQMRMDYWSFNNDELVCVKVERDEEYISQMITKEKEFWECVQTFTPPKLTDKDFVKQSNPVFIQMAQELKTVRNSKRELEKKEEDLKSSLISMCEDKSSIGGGLKFSKNVRKGSIDWKSIVEKECQPDDEFLSHYRKENIIYWSITET